MILFHSHPPIPAQLPIPAAKGRLSLLQSCWIPLLRCLWNRWPFLSCPALGVSCRLYQGWWDVFFQVIDRNVSWSQQPWHAAGAQGSVIPTPRGAFWKLSSRQFLIHLISATRISCPPSFLIKMTPGPNLAGARVRCADNVTFISPNL